MEKDGENLHCEANWMNTLFLDSGSAIKVELGMLAIEHNKVKETHKPNRIPYDNILLNRANGYISFLALRMLSDKDISLSMLDYDGNIITQESKNVNNGVKRIAQYQR